MNSIAVPTNLSSAGSTGGRGGPNCQDSRGQDCSNQASPSQLTIFPVILHFVSILGYRYKTLLIRPYFLRVVRNIWSILTYPSSVTNRRFLDRRGAFLHCVYIYAI